MICKYHVLCIREAWAYSNRIDALNYKRTKLFKNECLSLLRKSYVKHRKDRSLIKKDFNFLVENSIIFKDLSNKSNRSVYKEFLQDLQKVTEIRENERLSNFLKLWEKEFINFKSVSRNNSVILRPLTKARGKLPIFILFCMLFLSVKKLMSLILIDKYMYFWFDMVLPLKTNFLGNKFCILVEVMRTYKTLTCCFILLKYEYYFLFRDRLICVKWNLVNYFHIALCLGAIVRWEIMKFARDEAAILYK